MAIDSHKRSIVKAVLWRVGSICVLIVISWMITHDVAETTAITAVYHFVAICLYYSYERFWDRVRWGRNNKGSEE